MLMTDSEKVTNYIAKHERWSEELATLRAIFQQTELKEEYLYNVDCATIKVHNIILGTDTGRGNVNAVTA